MEGLSVDLKNYALKHDVKIFRGRDILERAIQYLYFQNFDMIQADEQDLAKAVESIITIVSTGKECFEKTDCDLVKGTFLKLFVEF